MVWIKIATANEDKKVCFRENPALTFDKKNSKLLSLRICSCAGGIQ